MTLDRIDSGSAFDFGRVSEAYAKYRDIYPPSLYEKLTALGVGRPGQQILDLGSGTAVLPVNLAATGAQFTATDISENQVRCGRQTVEEKGLDNIRFRVCPAEETGFDDDSFDVVTAAQCFHYFDAEKAAAEIYRVLKPQGLFVKLFMDWLPREDAVIAEMEQFVLRYHPQWNGNGFDKFRYRFPDWAEERFRIETIHSYDTVLTFSREAWLGRVKSCRGVGAHLTDEALAAFTAAYRRALERYPEPLRLKHQIHIELYRSDKR